MNEMPEKRFGLLKSIFFTTLVVFVFIIIVEVGLSLFLSLSKENYRGVTGYSKELGWETKSNISLAREVKDYGYVNFSTQHNGFRQFGDVHSTRKKLLVIGDSQTLSVKVSDGDTYQEYIAKEGDFELFAYGGGGYGSLQEYMILDRYYDEIKPDIVLWQFCSNDLHNNLFELESSSWKRNNHMIRPYLVEGEIVYLYPHPSWVYRNIFRHSKLIKLIGVNINAIFWHHGSEQEVLDKSNWMIQKSINVTSAIMSRVREKAKQSKVFAFSACSRHYPKINMDNLFSDIAETNKLIYIHGITAAINTAQGKGVRVNGLPEDAHWNAEGNKIAGKVILDFLMSYESID